MGKEKENAALLRKSFETWHDTRGGSIDHWLQLFAEDVDFRSLAEGDNRLAFTKRRCARDEAAEYLHGLVAQLEMNEYRVDDYIAQGDRVVAIGSTAWTNRQTGKSFDTPKVDLVRFRDGQITEFFELYDTDQVMATSDPEGPMRKVPPNLPRWAAPHADDQTEDNETNVKALKKIYAAWDESKGTNTDIWLEIFADDVEMRSLADGAQGLEFSSYRKSKEEAAQYFAGLAADWTMVYYSIDEYVAQNGRVVAIGNMEWQSNRTGTKMESPKVDCWRFEKGKVVAFLEFYDTAKAIAAANAA